MIRKMMVGVALVMASMGMAFAQVDVNKADAASLDGVKGLGPAKTKAILEERTKNGDFKDWADLQQRVKGIGDKAAMRLSSAGLVVNGKPMAGAPAAEMKGQPESKPAKK
ncbi:ComEA family DNA-binding protein [Pseudoduganella sp. GCM10020061]|jgi:competence protein ComEA|uniref:ComEA family DNA-binding protein n=1 Tax=Pseudoduganella sp. GCM10020061 TaxID=3317345 RepID=UPI00362582EF